MVNEVFICIPIMVKHVIFVLYLVYSHTVLVCVAGTAVGCILRQPVNGSTADALVVDYECTESVVPSVGKVALGFYAHDDPRQQVFWVTGVGTTEALESPTGSVSLEEWGWADGKRTGLVTVILVLLSINRLTESDQNHKLLSHSHLNSLNPSSNENAVALAHRHLGMPA